MKLYFINSKTLPEEKNPLAMLFVDNDEIVNSYFRDGLDFDVQEIRFSGDNFSVEQALEEMRFLNPPKNEIRPDDFPRGKDIVN